MINALGIFIMGFAFGVALTILLALIVEKRVRRERQERKQLYFDDYGYDPKECEECHLPGDCPLCGGK